MEALETEKSDNGSTNEEKEIINERVAGLVGDERAA